MPPFSQNHSYQEKAYSESSSSDSSSRGRWEPHFQQYGQKTQTPNPVPLILKHLPQKDARILFLAHAKLIHSSSQTAKEYANAFHTLFPLEKIDSHQILQGLTARTHTFLQNAAETLQENRSVSVSTMVKQLESMLTAQKIYLLDLKQTLLQIRQQCRDIGTMEVQRALLLHERHKAELEEAFRKKHYSEETHDDLTNRDLLRMAEYEESELCHEMDLAQSAFLREEYVQDLILSFEELSSPKHPPSMGAHEKEEARQTLAKLKKIKVLYIHLHRKLEEVLYGRKSIPLLRETFKTLPETVDTLKPDLKPNPDREGPVYFPVGISSDLPRWEHVLEGKLSAAKPIDLYAYLFWLNNQNQKVELVVCDTIQENNYVAEYAHLSPKEAHQKALLIGDREVEHYQHILSTFGLDNITLVRYDTFIERNRERFNYYRNLCEKLAEHPSFKDAFLNTVQESRVRDDVEKKHHLGYAVDEIAWTLATHGTKIGHIKEARYDALSLLIETIEKYAETRSVDRPFSPENEDFLQDALRDMQTPLRQELSGRVSTLSPTSPEFSYFKQLEAHLFGTSQGTTGISFKGKSASKIPLAKEKTVEQKIIRTLLRSQKILDAYIPATIGSASFGYRQEGREQKGVLKFREPYSTYFYTSETLAFLDADQILALPDGILFGKVLSLEDEKQKEYGEKVLFPLLAQYFKTLQRAPESYFTHVGLTYKQLLAECCDCATLNDTVRFIQKYIIAPSTPATV